MIGPEDARYTYEYTNYYKVLPAINSWDTDVMRIKDGKRVPDEFTYSSNNNPDWMSGETLGKWIEKNLSKIGKI